MSGERDISLDLDRDEQLEEQIPLKDFLSKKQSLQQPQLNDDSQSERKSEEDSSLDLDSKGMESKVPLSSSPFKHLLSEKQPLQHQQLADDSLDRIPFCQVKQIMTKVKKAQIANQCFDDTTTSPTPPSSPSTSQTNSAAGVGFVSASPGPVISERTPSLEVEKGEISAGNVLDLDFIYDDSDHFASELAEFYSYTEAADFDDNKESFYDLLGKEKEWSKLSEKEQKNLILVLLDCLEVASEEKRLGAVRALAYLCQGNFSEIESESELISWTRKNCFLLYKMGIFLALFDTLKLKVDIYLPRQGDKTVAGATYGSTYAPSTVAPNAGGAGGRKPNSQQAATLGDCIELRMILSVLYTITEVLRTSDLADTKEQAVLREQFVSELGQPIIDGELPAVILFQLVLNVASDKSSPIPTKKTLLLLWKIILSSLGGLDHAQELKNSRRLELGLDPLPEDSIKVVRQMRASTPPLIASEMLDQQQNPGASIVPPNTTAGGSPSAAAKKRAAGKRLNKGANASGDVSGPRDSLSLDELPEGETPSDLDDSLVDDGGGGDSPDDEEFLISLEPTPERPREPRALPWQPKIRTKDIQDFLDHSRIKYVGYKLKSDPEPDLTTLAGLPQPIKESVAILRQHLYIPLSEVQLKNEDLLLKHPISKGRAEQVDQTPTELLYKAIHPNLPQYMIALLKILLAATPTSPQGKSDTVNLLSDLLPPQMPSGVVEAMKLTIDMNRHKEIIVKSVSALLLLLLKHFKLNHICQFEHCAQHMVFANCIPLVLKFFNQSIGNYVQAQNTIAPLEFPRCVIGEKEEISEENIKPVEKGVTFYCWRNLFSCINLLRILNKLVKWKNSRIMMLVVFKSGPILKRALKVRQAMLQLYVLKLIKVQTKFLGRQWRKSNMKTMSVIYQKVRHRLHDDWAFGNEPDSRPWDFQLEEGLLRSRVEKFNSRRYESGLTSGTSGGTNSVDSTYEPVDNNLYSLLNQDIQLPKVFTDNYEQWLEKEVFLRNINWDVLLES
ncbi:striatin-interacting protein 1 homolog isoform X3 [Convolutriloba macropyga]|uniref:striatin-interacting protein 1 homolog isoform X3 n=1 Tax=Convolutriloba macropyga TaxID=536237 RepID=UPI003F51AED2